MSNTSEKLSASVRKAKTSSEPGAAADREKPAAENRRKPAARSTAKPTARRRAPKAPAAGSEPKDSHRELFPSRVWPD